MGEQGLTATTWSRRSVLAGPVGALAGLAPAGPAAGADPHFQSHLRGSIANPGHRGEAVRSALLFAGPPNPASLPLYTRHPRHAGRLDWSDEPDVRYALRQLRTAGLNTVKLSYWGHEGETDQWATSWLFSQRRWPGDGDGTYTEAEQVHRARRLFRLAARESLLVAPMLEVSPAFPFYAQFPDDLGELVRRATWLLGRFGREPGWLRLRDLHGRPRPVLWLIETIHAGEVHPAAFAAGFDRAAAQIESATGIRPGFVIDPTPLPAYGPTAGPDPAALLDRASVVAVNPFNVTSQGPGDPKQQSEISDEERLAYAAGVLRRWSASGLPLVAPLLPGYDAHLVFPDNGVYGFTPAWRSRQTGLALRHQTAGLSVDCWNGWTEGYAVVPSVESGTAELRWVQRAMRRLDRRLDRRVDRRG